MTGEQVAGIVRTLLAAAGGWVISSGIFSASDWTAIVGAAGIVVAAGWSYFSKKKTA
jgi:hypothetical protein